MGRLLIVHHTPSPAMQAMFESVVAGAGTDEIDGVEVVIRPALTAAAVDVLEADGYLLGTSANIGYMSGALKHFFDGIYYPCLEATQRRPYALYVHGASDTGRSRPGRGGHRHRAEVAPRPAAGLRDRPAGPGRPRGVLGAGRHGRRGARRVIVTVTLNPALHVGYEAERVSRGAANEVSRVSYRAGGRGLAVAGCCTRSAMRWWRPGWSAARPAR